GNAHVVVAEFAGKVKSSRVAFHGRTDGQKDLLYFGVWQAFQQRVDVEVRWPYAFNRRDHTAQHVVQALELRGILDSDYIADVAYYAQQAAVAQRVEADTTYLSV